MMAGVKTVRVALLVAVGVLAVAAPAGAATPVVATQEYQWFYWLAPILTIGAILAIVAVSGGYVKKVLLLKYRGRKVKE
jgi:hypothetical protein